ncbi:MAG: DUF11 domain-containing protein [Planctomycetes bacterium]|nr:DUF11 domain-containing protein [Planctomycetota bacterium]
MLNVTLSGAATISAGANDSATLTISGTEADINATLASLKYTSSIGTLADTLTVLSTDGTALTDTDPVAITVSNAANLVTVKTLQSADATPNEGDSVTFRITVTNNGAAQATTVALTDSLPAGITYAGNVASQGAYVPGTGVWTIGTLNNGASVTLDLTGTVDVGRGGDTLTNTTVKATGDQPDPTDAGDDLTEAVVVDNNANLVTVKTLQSADATPNEGDSVTFRITVTNNGAAQATTVALTDSLPAGITYAGNVASQGAYVPGTGVWTIGTLNNGASVTLDLTGTVDAGEGGNTITNSTVKATGDQTDPTDAGNDLTEAVLVNRLPVANADTNNATEAGPAVNGDVRTNDNQGDPAATVTSASQGANPIVLGVPFVTAAGGSLTLNANGTYSYTPPPDGNVPLAGLDEIFNYTITDANGDTSSSTLTISIVDTTDLTPVATPNVNAAVEGGAAVSGNVRADDTLGNLPTVVFAANQAGTAITLGSAFATAGGGSLTLNADGTYSYTPPAALGEGGAFTEVFNYTIRDNDGDTSTSTLTVTVDRLPAAVADVDGAVEGGAAVNGNVIPNDDEGNTNAAVTAASQQGNANPLVLGVAFATSAGGSLTVNADGTYSYTAPAALPEGGTITEVFDYTIADNDGDPSSSTLTITVDRLPSANADTNSAVEAGPAVNGNVIPNDDEGNTSATVTAADQGGNAIIIGNAFATAAGGSLTLNADGTYSYAPPAAVGEGAAFSEVFTYTITDNDGDTSSSTLTVSVDRLPSAVADANAATEGGAAVLGNVIPNDDEGNTSATVTAASQPGNANPLVLGAAFTTSAGGSLTLNGNGTYSYTPPAVLAAGAALTEQFSYTLTDADGDTSTTTLTLTVDRLPSASADVRSVLEGDPAVAGSVMPNDDQGNTNATVTAADQGGAPLVIGVPFATAAGGVLTLNADGSFSYTPPATGTVPVAGVVEVFNYTITDADGDVASSTLTLNVVDNGELAPTAVADTGSTVEAAAPIAGNVLTNDDQGNAPATVIAGAQGAAPLIIGTPFATALGGSLTLNANGTYSYTAPAHLAEGGALTEVFSYTMADVDGDPSASTLTLTIDRLPTAVADANAATEGGAAVAGNLLPNDDEGNVNATVTSGSQPGNLNPLLLGVPFATTGGGSLTLNADGTYSYTPPAALGEGVALTEVFNYTITDADGDSSTSTLSITVDRRPAAVADTNTAPEGAAAVNGDVIANDDEGNTSATVTASDQAGRVIGFGVPFATDEGGSLTLNANGTFSYTPPAALPEGGAITEVFNYTITDADGDTSSSTLTVTVDRLPTAVADTNAATEGGAAVIGSLMANDDEGNTNATVTAGAQPGNLNALALGVPYATSAGGSLTLNADGTYSYTPPAALAEGAALIEVFNYTIADNDGDTSSSTLSVTVDRLPAAVADPGVATEGGPAVVGTVLANDDEGNTNATVTAADEGGTALVIGTPFATANGGTLTLNADGSYSYTPPAALPQGGIVTEVINYTINDADGDASAATLTLTVDRLPLASPNTMVATPGGPATTGNVIADDDQGNQPAAVTSANQNGTTIPIGSPFTTAAGGTLILNADGTYRYTAPASVPAGQTQAETFNYTITDADGDTSSSILTGTLDLTGVSVSVPPPSGDLVPGSEGTSQGFMLNNTVVMPTSTTPSPETTTGDGPAYYYVRPAQIRPPIMLSLSPLFSGHAEAGSTLTVRLYDQNGSEIGTQTVVVDAGGNWLATFNSTVIFDEPHRVELALVAASYDDSPDALFNLRTFFAPAIMRGFFSDEAVSVGRAFTLFSTTALHHLAHANGHPITLGQVISGYELLAQQPTPAGY